jgi:hypothetical protein
MASCGAAIDLSAVRIGKLDLHGGNPSAQVIAIRE